MIHSVHGNGRHCPDKNALSVDDCTRGALVQHVPTHPYPMSLLRFSRSFVATALTISLAACGSDDAPSATAEQPTKPADRGEPAGPTPVDDAARVAERPWEVISNKGESYVPDVFYADASQNEQIMPYAIDGHVMIDRLIYPTLGNPNLYVKADPSDEFVTVMRIEDEAIAHLAPKVEPIVGSPLSRLVIPMDDPTTGIAFFLVPRVAREPNTASKTAISNGAGTDVIRVYPHEILVNPEPPDMPAALKARKTVRFVFKQGAMAKVPAGLYDVRVEIRNNNQIVKPAAGAAYEYQYNALRVFDQEPDEYSVINVTDTQVTVGNSWEAKSRDRLEQFVNYLNTSRDPNVRQASFITFNGDLHNGGSMWILRQKAVAKTYNDEAKAILDQLKYLPFPIFLTAGNHDGYASTGQVPGAIKAVDTAVGTSLAEVIQTIKPAWPNYDPNAFASFLAQTAGEDRLGGRHRDVFLGGFARDPKGTTFAESFREIPREDRNYILYDGFHQWQKTYGPLYYSHKFAKSHYVSLNSFELRQHRRTGWGMYTVNYGGGMMDTQIDWLDRELLRAKDEPNDIVVLAHHDPRGGHKAQDHGYYFEQLEYRSIYQSGINYVEADIWNPIICDFPAWALSGSREESCTHDGLQEWMRQDPEFDCAFADKKPDGTCDDTKGFVPFLSGIELMKRLAGNPRIRTVLLGHTHYNSYEVLRTGDQLIPGTLPVGDAAGTAFASLEVQNPVRGFSFAPSHVVADRNGVAAHRRARLAAGLSEFAPPRPDEALLTGFANYDADAVPLNDLVARYERFAKTYAQAAAGWSRTLENVAGAGPRELMILRLVSNADMSKQELNGQNIFGFSTFHMTRILDERNVSVPQLNRATFFVNAGGNEFTNVNTVDLNRTISITPHDARNPVEQIFDW